MSMQKGNRKNKNSMDLNKVKQKEGVKRRY